MFTDPIFRAFAKKRPIAVLGQMALGRLLDAETLNRLFAESADVQYERSLMFSSVVELLSAVVLGKHPSVNAAYKKAKDEIGVSLNSVYGKLDRLEPQIGQALVRHSFAQIAEIRKEIGGNPRHDVAGYRTRIIDGNHLSKTQHRLAETRKSTAGPLPGKSLVVLDPRYKAIVDFFPIEDGHAQERSALDEVLATVRSKDLWVADRNFCTLKPMFEISNRGAAFIIRHHKKLIGQDLSERKEAGTCDTGVIYERTMTVVYEGDELVLRRIEVDLTKPTRDGSKTLVILTNLSVDEADAEKIAAVYQGRWRIEKAFHTLTVSLNCEIRTLCYPKAALFAFALAIVAYNALAVVHAIIAVAKSREEADSLSSYYMALEIGQTTDGMLVVLPSEKWLELAEVPLNEYLAAARVIAAEIDISVYRKAPTRKRKKPTKKKHQKNKVHVSTARLLAQRK